MSHLAEKFKNLVYKKQFVCSSDLINKKKKDIELTDISFHEVYKETRQLASDIIEKLDDQRRKTKALYSAFNSASDAIAVIDSEGYIVYINESFLNLYKYSINDVLGQNMVMFSSGQTPKQVFKEMWDTIKSNQIWQGEISNRDSCGNDIKVISKILPIMNGKPEPIYYVCTQREI
jgi:PAS domain S-box-containing protein